ncbi:MAG TPA: M23 family metallopeptidase [Vicinamibacterales bacterium]|jgi:murein DD-endopeptidase MepM/ murein hydrolase activator NlpD
MRCPAASRFCFGLALLLGVSGCVQDAERPRSGRPDIFLVSDTETIEGRIPRAATLASLLHDVRLRDDLVQRMVALSNALFDPRRLKADNRYRLERTVDGLLRSFECQIDTDRFLRIVGQSDERPVELKAELVAYHKQRALVSLRGEINEFAPSLFAAMEEAGEGPDLSVELADIFGGEIDFNSELQPGDEFSLTFEKIYREGQFSGYGGILAAEFSNSGRVLRAVRYTLPGGKPGYYDADGRSLRRFFLKSPLKFAASVSSGFSRARQHPILRIVRPHFGVDYRAPAGAPVVAVANGTVVAAGWSGEAGRLIHLRHASGYETLYMHLASISAGVRVGAHVSQGDVIGRVGMTGLATGPHLDYRVKKGGSYLNPLVVHRSLPPGEPIPPALLAQFRTARDRVLAWLVPSTRAATADGH